MDLYTTEYETSKGILQHPNAYEATPIMIKPTDTCVTAVDGRKVVKAGTIVPSNDAKARGVALQDYDVTDGERPVAAVYMGTVNVSKLPTAPDETAKTALPRITWYTKTTAVAARSADPASDQKIK